MVITIFILLALLSFNLNIVQQKTCPHTHHTAKVIFISPTNTEIDSLKEEWGDNFYTVADDAMYYRSEAFTLLKSNNLRYEVTRCKKHKFLLDKEYVEIDYTTKSPGWYMILWNAKEEPVGTYPINIHQHLEYLRIEI